MTHPAVQNLDAAQLIRRRAASPTTRRYTAALPVYQITQQIPQYMADMLARLETAEMRNKG